MSINKYVCTGRSDARSGSASASRRIAASVSLRVAVEGMGSRPRDRLHQCQRVRQARRGGRGVSEQGLAGRGGGPSGVGCLGERGRREAPRLSRDRQCRVPRPATLWRRIAPAPGPAGRQGSAKAPRVAVGSPSPHSRRRSAPIRARTLGSCRPGNDRREPQPLPMSEPQPVFCSAQLAYLLCSQRTPEPHSFWICAGVSPPARCAVASFRPRGPMTLSAPRPLGSPNDVYVGVALRENCDRHGGRKCDRRDRTGLHRVRPPDTARTPERLRASPDDGRGVGDPRSSSGLLAP